MAELLLLENMQSPGDTLMFTCAVRDLHRAFPGEYVTSVHTPTPDIWRHNPYITTMTPGTGRLLRVGYSRAIKSCNSRNAHFATGFVQHLAELLQRPFRLTDLKADVYLTDEEKASPPLGVLKPYWLMMAGGKSDFTAKMWDTARWQATVQLLKDRVAFVQVGGRSHIHKPLAGVVDLLGKTTFRELMRLVYHAEGCICPVTCLMHLSAAFNKPCVVIAGGREPWWWEAYTRQTWQASAMSAVPADLVEQRYLHTFGKLPCCNQVGCWRTGIGDKKPGNNCMVIEQGETQLQPKCLRLITPQMAADAISAYMDGVPVTPERVPAFLQPPLFTLPLPPPEPEKPAKAAVPSVARKIPTRNPAGMKAVRRNIPAPAPVPVHTQARTLPVVKPSVMHVKDGKLITRPAVIPPQFRRTLTRPKPEVLQINASGKQLAEAKAANVIAPLDDYRRRLMHVNLPITVCVLTYGDYLPLVRRCVDSLYKWVPPEIFHLRLGMNAVTAPVREWAKQLTEKGNVTLYDSPENLFKYPMMRRMFEGLPDGWVLWFDDDSYADRSSWLLSLSQLMLPVYGVLGKKYFSNLKTGQPAWIEKAAWYTGRPLESRKGKPISTFATGGFWAAQTAVIKKLDWPDPRLANNGGDIMFGAACWQHEVVVKQVYDGSVKISAHPRRGVSQRHPGT